MFSSDGSDPNGENSFISVKLKTGYSFFDFIESEEFIPLTEGNYYISSNETLEMVAQLNSVKHLKRIITMAALSCAIALLLYVFYVLIYLRLMRRNIINVRNYGYSQKTVSETIKKKLNNKNLFFVLIVVALAINLVLIHDKSFVAGYVPTLVVLCMALVLHCTHKVLIKLRVKRMYNWRYR
jgi:predicted histidine transporter YuiF (NhaC family)